MRWVIVALVAGCSAGDATDPDDIETIEVDNPLADPDDGPPAGNPDTALACDIPAEAGPEDVSDPHHGRGGGNPSQLHLRRLRRCRGRGRHHHLRLRARSGDHHARPHRQGVQRHRTEDRHRRGRAGHPERWRRPPHPVHEHLRQGPGVDDLALSTTKIIPQLTVQNLTFIVAGNATGEAESRRRGRDLRTGRPVQGRQLPVLQQHVRRRRSGRWRCRQSGYSSQYNGDQPVYRA